MEEKVNSGIGTFQALVVGILSWSILAAISIIISGKLVVKRLPLGLNDDALFSIPLYLFKIKATGDEVSIGFLMFILSLGSVVSFGGEGAYQFFRKQAGIDIGQWNSLCLIAGFFALMTATIVCIIVPLFRSDPLISDEDRDDLNKRLRDR